MCKNADGKIPWTTCLTYGLLTVLAAGMCFGAFYWLGYAFKMSTDQTLQMAGGAAGGAGILGSLTTAYASTLKGGSPNDIFGKQLFRHEDSEEMPMWCGYGYNVGVGMGFSLLVLCCASFVALWFLEAPCCNLECIRSTFWSSKAWSVISVLVVSGSTLWAF